jgi:phage-related protein
LGSAFVQIRADVSRFAREVRRGVNNALADVEDYLTRGRFPNAVRRAGAQAGRDFARLFNTFANNINIEIDRKKLLGFLRGFGKITLAIGAAANALSTLTPLIVSLGSALASVGTAAAATIPFLISGFVAVAATLKLAFKGVSDAIGAALTGDVEKLDEALKALSPSAQAFVKEIAAVEPKLKLLQQTIQESFFAPLKGGFTELINSGILNTLRKEMSGIASDAGKALRGALDVVAASRAQIGEILTGTREAFSNLAALLPRLIEIFIKLAAAVAPFAEAISGLATDAIDRFLDRVNAFVESGGVAEAFQAVGDIVKQVGSVLADLGAIVGAVFGALLGGTERAQAPLAAVLSTIREFVESAEGAATIEAIGKAFQQVGVIVSGVLRPLLPVVGKLITALAGPLLSILERLTRPLIRLAEDIGVLIGRFLEAGGPILDKLIDVLTEFAVQALGLVAKHIEELGPFFSEFMRQIGPELIPLVEALGEALLALIPIIPAITEAMVTLAPAVIKLIPLFVFMINATTLLWQGIAILIGFLAELIGWILKVVASGLAKYFEFIAFMVGTVWPPIFDAVRAALSAWFDWWIKGWQFALDSVRDAISTGIALLGKLRDTVSNTVGSIGDAIGRIPGLLSSFVGRIGSAAQAIGQAIGNGIAAIPGFAVNIAQRIVDRIRGFANNVISNINNAIFRIAQLIRFSLPYIPFLAEGAIIDQPTLAVLGERGREVVLPLDDPARARELADQAGLASLLGDNFGEGSAPSVQVFIGDEEITKRVDVRIMKFNKGQARELAYGPRGA